MSSYTIDEVTIVNEGRRFVGSLSVRDGLIAEVRETPSVPEASRAGGAGELLLLPGVIDEHVHFREPGLTHKADIASESRAAAAGGVTTYFDMPNCVPQTTTPDAWEDKMRRAEACSAVNYAFYFGATNDNAALFPRLDTRHVPAVKLFMGSSTGDMLVERREALRRVFAESPLPIVAHCEDSALIARNLARIRAFHGDDPDVRFHPLIRNREACIASTRLAAGLAEEYGARLLVAHVTTAEELDMASASVSLEACVPHLLFTSDDYAALGTRIKCNPAVKERADREALRRALSDGRILTVGTDHAPHLLEEKRGGAIRAVSGMPMVQYSLVAMLGLVDEGVLTPERLVELMCHAPARFFGIERRGFLRPGYKADFVLVRRAPWTLRREQVLSKCGWSPLEGRTFGWRVERTYCNGRLVFDGSSVATDARGEAVTFRQEVILPRRGSCTS